MRTPFCWSLSNDTAHPPGPLSGVRPPESEQAAPAAAAPSSAIRVVGSWLGSPVLGVVHHPADVDHDDRLVAHYPAVVAGGQQRDFAPARTPPRSRRP